MVFFDIRVSELVLLWQRLQYSCEGSLVCRQLGQAEVFYRRMNVYKQLYIAETDTMQW